MRRTRDPKYCRVIIICHGKSEKILFSKLKSLLKLPIKVVANDNGNSSIKIQGIRSYLNQKNLKAKKTFANVIFKKITLIYVSRTRNMTLNLCLVN